MFIKKKVEIDIEQLFKWVFLDELGVGYTVMLTGLDLGDVGVAEVDIGVCSKTVIRCQMIVFLYFYCVVVGELLLFFL